MSINNPDSFNIENGQFSTNTIDFAPELPNISAQTKAAIQYSQNLEPNIVDDSEPFFSNNNFPSQPETTQPESSANISAIALENLNEIITLAMLLAIIYLTTREFQRLNEIHQQLQESFKNRDKANQLAMQVIKEQQPKDKQVKHTIH